MFLSIWNYLTGYVIVEVSGYSLEKFVNMALYHHLKFWDVKHKDGKLYLKTSIATFKELKPCAKKTRCRIRIIEKCGFPFLRFRYRKRNILILGSLLFMSIVCFLSSFVWGVEVSGMQRVNELDIVNCLKENGYDVGRWKGKLDLRKAEKCIIDAYPDVVWTGISFEGTKLVVQISETIPKPTMEVSGNPSDLIATRDALVTYIATERGIPQVKKGDIVAKGQTLVSGKSAFQEREGLYTTDSKATVKGKTVYTLKASVNKEQIEKEYTDEVATSFSLKLFQNKFPLFRTKKVFDHYDVLITSTPFNIANVLVLPIYFEKYQYVAYDPIPTQLSLEEAQDILLGALNDKLLGLIDKQGEILYRQIAYEETDDQVIAIFNAIVEENISQMRPLAPEDLVIPQEPINQP